VLHDGRLVRVVSEPRRSPIVVEAPGTALLVAAVIARASWRSGSPGIAPWRSSPTRSRPAALVAILLIFGPISGAHLNPAVTLCMVAMKAQTRRNAVGYIAAQIAGGIAGAILADAMFELPLVTWSMTVRAGGAQLLSEAVATFGLLCVVIAVGRIRAALTPLAVAAYIVAAYWFTASTSFANPAVTMRVRSATRSPAFAGRTSARFSPRRQPAQPRGRWCSPGSCQRSPATCSRPMPIR
jgi:glycerol uptake facilitator-like aquaporin